MKEKNKRIQRLALAIGALLVAGAFQPSVSQNVRWLRVGQLQSYFVDYGAECELTSFPNNFLTWPTLYGDNQYMIRSRGFWLGCRNFNDPVENKIKSVKVIGSGPRYDQANLPGMIFSANIRLIGRSYPPIVTVDGQTGTNNTLYDVLDEQQDNLPSDRMIVITFNTSMGVSVTKKILAFTQQNHENYFIYDYVFKNTGIVNSAGRVVSQTLNDFWAYFNYRYAFSGVTSSGYGSSWGAFASEWGVSTEFTDFGQYNGSTMRGFYGYYAPENERRFTGTVSPYDLDWGCPNQQGGEQAGLLGAAKYLGVVTLLASRSAQDWTDDANQPATTAYISCDNNPQLIMNATTSQYDETFMGERYRVMTEGHLAQTMEQSVGSQFVQVWQTSHVDRDGGGGSSMGQGFGPYTLAPGDSIHIVFAEGANGLSWEQCRQIGNVWYSYYTGTGAPSLNRPDGTTDTSFTSFARAWVETGRDSIMQTFRNATSNFASNYAIPQAPPAPNTFTVQSGGDRIRLSWADNARSAAHFNGYVIYRSEGRTRDFRAVYTKIFECDASNTATEYDDKTAARGFNYYYYIQSKDDGTQNDVHPGVPLYSSLFLTMTTVAATLQRPAADYLSELRVVPNPYNIRGRMLQFGTSSQYDRIAFYGLPPICKLKIFTERGDLIWEKDHTSSTGDELWNSMTSSGQIVVSGVYILYVEVTQDTYAAEDKIAQHNIYDDDSNLMFREGAMIFHRGDLMFKKGDSKFRKFIIVR